jgi:hypothetical protein
MRKLLSAVALGGALLALGIGVASAASSKATVQLKPPANTHMMAIAHAFGTAKITYTAHDADIKLTTDKLPKPSVIHEAAYVLWLVHGKQKANAGALKINGNMAGLHVMTMNTMFTKLVVTAEKMATEKTPMGPQVLVGNVMHH